MSIISNIQKQEIHAMYDKNPNLRPKLEKVVVNIAVGISGEILQKAASVLEKMTEQTPAFVTAKKSVKEFGIRKGENIAVKVTLRGEKAKSFLKRAMVEKDYKLLRKSFDDYGNFSFGVKEHINFPGMKYDPSTGIFGFDVSVRIVRPGYRVRTRKTKASKIPRRQFVSKDEAMLFMQENFDAEVVEKIEQVWY
ncbi:50S ribosomal protein L5 [Candidatus Bathyarchaeota archaeon]|nr:50S ribosomal protein L5 [Candidatus Bathyarchaeota archaeon]